jgi:hypothetical protein
MTSTTDNNEVLEALVNEVSHLLKQEKYVTQQRTLNSYQKISIKVLDQEEEEHPMIAFKQKSRMETMMGVVLEEAPHDYLHHESLVDDTTMLLPHHVI